MATPLNQSKYVVLLLGAGASFHHRVPLMKNFLNVARDRYFDAKRRGIVDLTKFYDCMFEFYLTCRRSLWAFERDWDNIEELYTQADLLRLSDEANAEQLCRDIAWVIWDVYRLDRHTGRHPQATLSGVVQQIRATHQVPIIITTNYDLACEHELDRPWFYPGFDAPSNHPTHEGIAKLSDPYSGLFPNETRRNSTPIIKLHGSINWFNVGNDWIADHSLEEYDQDVQQAHARHSFLKRYSGGSAATEITPGIIPPMLSKSNQAHLFIRQWRAAIEALSGASELWIVGYSFPRTDAFMSRLLTQGLLENNDFRALTVVDITDPAKHGINDLLSKQMSENKFRYVRCPADAAFNEMKALRINNWRQRLAHISHLHFKS